MEIGYGQAVAVRELMAGIPSLQLLRIREDLQGIPRTVVLERVVPRAPNAPSHHRTSAPLAPVAPMAP